MKGTYAQDHHAVDDATDWRHGFGAFADDGFELVSVRYIAFVDRDIGSDFCHVVDQLAHILLCRTTARY